MNVYDSSALIELLDQTKKGKKIQQKLSNTLINTTAINIHELLVGAENKKEIFLLQGLFRTFNILSFNASAAEFSALIEQNLKKEGKKVKDADLFISAICLQHKATLITCDKDFKKVNGLDLIIF